MPVHIGEHIEQNFEMAVAGLGVVTGVFLTGKRIYITTNAFNGLTNLFGRALACALKKEMLEKM